MSDTKKILSAPFYINALATVLGIAGLVTMIICSTMDAANILTDLTTLVIMAVVGIALLVFVSFSLTKPAMHDIIRTIAGIIAVMLFATVIGNMIDGRVMLVSGLFSFNSGNIVGWNVFYVTIASAACYLAASLLVIIGAFFTAKK